MLKKAKELLSKGEAEEALKVTEKLLEEEGDKDRYQGQVLRGKALLDLGRTEESEGALKEAAAAQPALPLAWLGLAQLYHRSLNHPAHAHALSRLLPLFFALPYLPFSLLPSLSFWFLPFHLPYLR